MPLEDCPWVCVPPALSGQLPYGLIVLSDADLQQSSSEVRVVVGRDATFSSYDIGATLPADPNRYDLVVGRNLSYGPGDVSSGAVAYGGTLSVDAAANALGGWHQEAPLNPAQLAADIGFWSEELAGQLGACPVSNAAELSFECDQQLCVLAATADELSLASEIRVVAPAGSTVLINVFGTHLALGTHEFTFEGGADREHLLLNLPDAQTLTLGTTPVQASILAPLANLDFADGAIDGLLIVNNWLLPPGSSAGLVRAHYFAGCPWVCI